MTRTVAVLFVFLNTVFVISLGNTYDLPQRITREITHSDEEATLRNIGKALSVLNRTLTHSKCKDGHCSCNAGFELHSSGKLCQPMCYPGCENGYCYLPGVCECFPGYKRAAPGSHLCVPSCSQGCLDGEECVAPENCTCKEGYTRSPLTEDCYPLCEERCENGYCHKPNRCKCHPGYKKDPKSKKCRPECTGGCRHGVCALPDMCLCNPGYKRDPINPNICIPKCLPECEHAVCVGPNQCRCNANYVKDRSVLAGNVCVHVNLLPSI